MFFMEVYKYITKSAFEKAKQEGALNPSRIYGEVIPIHALPNDPLVWGINETIKLLDWIKETKHEAPEVLVKWKIPLNIRQTFIQEGSKEPWSKIGTQKPLAEYHRSDFANPEVVLWRSVPIDAIEVVEFPEALKGKF
jgi:hypothetical protein